MSRNRSDRYRTVGRMLLLSSLAIAAVALYYWAIYWTGERTVDELTQAYLYTFFVGVIVAIGVGSIRLANKGSQDK
ncbi:hypothetical protein [Natronocalculus amylovorans]|uniref:Uncharacterized protein n=1 Tax=Natronocalculus amylovorans TaxID=2917812 RepID=A0AAE3K893_9EURY|nr:hypothetical protein [Natronocalculus amylovorans]MCL9816806.1 hypothetical protein [Natronocalculus amylovorans]